MGHKSNKLIRVWHCKVWDQEVANPQQNRHVNPLTIDFLLICSRMPLSPYSYNTPVVISSIMCTLSWLIISGGRVLVFILWRSIRCDIRHCSTILGIYCVLFIRLPYGIITSLCSHIYLNRCPLLYDYQFRISNYYKFIVNISIIIWLLISGQFETLWMISDINLTKI